MIVSGKISVKAILKYRKRPIKCVYMLDSKRDKESRYVESIAKGLKIEKKTREQLDELAQNTSHGGYLLECEARYSDRVNDLTKGSLSLMLVEGVSDPFNMGEICRTAQAMGFDGIVSNHYDFGVNEAKLIRASAGASESLWWLQSQDLEKDIKSIKEKDVVIGSAHRGDDSVSLFDYKMPERFCICLGGALRGLSRKVLDQSDVFVRIDYDARVSLSTVGACSVFAYERYRQKG